MVGEAGRRRRSPTRSRCSPTRPTCSPTPPRSPSPWSRCGWPAGRRSGGYTYGLKRAEILSAQANGITLLLLAAWLGYEAVRRLLRPAAGGRRRGAHHRAGRYRGQPRRDLVCPAGRPAQSQHPRAPTCTCSPTWPPSSPRRWPGWSILADRIHPGRRDRVAGRRGADGPRRRRAGPRQRPDPARGARRSGSTRPASAPRWPAHAGRGGGARPARVGDQLRLAGAVGARAGRARARLPPGAQ